MRIINSNDVRVGDWLHPQEGLIVNPNVIWPQQVIGVYKTDIGGQFRVKYAETPCGHSDAPACIFMVFRVEE